MIVNVAKCLNVSTDYLLGNDVKINKSEEEIKEKEALKNLIEFIKINRKYIKAVK